MTILLNSKLISEHFGKKLFFLKIKDIEELYFWLKLQSTEDLGGELGGGGKLSYW